MNHFWQLIAVCGTTPKKNILFLPALTLVDSVWKEVRITESFLQIRHQVSANNCKSRTNNFCYEVERSSEVLIVYTNDMKLGCKRGVNPLPGIFGNFSLPLQLSKWSVCVLYAWLIIFLNISISINRQNSTSHHSWSSLPNNTNAYTTDPLIQWPLFTDFCAVCLFAFLF